ncbi:MAG: ABC transporter ATP-binding protein [Lacrimispora sp.]
MAPLLELISISKYFSGFCANHEINLTVEAGKVYGLLGENGAGKSTLMNILYGLEQPDEGAIHIDGKPERISSPRAAISKGIGMVHQHFMLIPALTVTENVILAMDGGSHLFLDKKSVAKRILELSDRYHLQIDPHAKVGDLTVGQQQRVEILKAVYKDCRLLILDEPTAVLTPKEIDELCGMIRHFKEEQKSVIFITHKLNEVMRVSDSICVLRSGEKVAEVSVESTTQQELASLMVGKAVAFRVEKEKRLPGKEVLSVTGLVVKHKNGHRAVDGLSLMVREGEIYGIVGVDGNGQPELVQAITALTKIESGSVEILGQDVTRAEPRQVLDCGVSHIPEDRQQMGIAMRRTVTDNLLLYNYKNRELKTGIFLDLKRMGQFAEAMVKKYNVKVPNLQMEIRYLSGGNQQKAVVAREMEKDPKLLLAVHPTRGVDIGAIEFIHKQIVAARNRGCAVLLVSTELEEVLSLSDRIGVIYEGKILGEMDQSHADIEKIGMLMAGSAEKQRTGA